MAHTFQFLPTSMVFEIEDPFSWVSNAISSENAFPDLSTLHQGRVVRKPVNANPGLKVNRGFNFSCIKVLYIAYVL